MRIALLGAGATGSRLARSGDEVAAILNRYVLGMAHVTSADVPLAATAASRYVRAAQTRLRESNITAIVHSLLPGPVRAAE